MKKVLCLLLSAIVILSLAACAGETSQTEPPADSAAEPATTAADPNLPDTEATDESSDDKPSDEQPSGRLSDEQPSGRLSDEPGRGAPEFSHPEDRPWEFSTYSTDWATDNFSDVMKSYSGSDLDPFSGADQFERNGDHVDSRYYISNDWYNIESDSSLVILSHFKTIQQSDQMACAIDCVLMVMEYYGLRDDWTEAGLLPLRRDHNAQHTGTCLDQMMDIFDNVGGFEYLTTYNYAPQFISPWLLRTFLRNGVPVIVGWSAWGGHWEVVIGYDDMGTPFNEYDDVLIFADPYDLTDHNQDGYTTYSAQRFFTEWSFYNNFPEDGSHISDQIFIAAWPST